MKLEQRFQIPAMESTSEEIMQSFYRAAYLDNNSYEILRQMLTTADFVKFAKASPLPDENERSLSNAYLFVKENKQTEKPKELNDTDKVDSD